MQKFDERIFREEGIKKEIYLDENNKIVIETYLLGLDSSGDRVLVESNRFDMLDVTAVNFFNRGDL